MSCCGQGGGRMVVSQKDIDAGLRFEIEYWGGRQVEVQGAVTGSRYVFSGLARTGLVDPRDASAILRNPAFRMKRAIRKSLTEFDDGKTGGSTG